MYFVYVIQSQVDGRIYVGLSASIENRIRDHNSGRVFSTKGYRPWMLVYYEKAGSRIEARKREKYLKSGCGKEFLKSIILG
jgi:putative endonuclease